MYNRNVFNRQHSNIPWNYDQNTSQFPTQGPGPDRRSMPGTSLGTNVHTGPYNYSAERTTVQPNPTGYQTQSGSGSYQPSHTGGSGSHTGTSSPYRSDGEAQSLASSVLGRYSDSVDSRYLPPNLSGARDSRFDQPSLTSHVRDTRFEETRFTRGTRKRASRFDPPSLTSDARDSRFDPPSLTSDVRDSRFDPPSLTSDARDSRFDPPSLTSGARDSRFDPPSLTSDARDSQFDPPSLTSGARDSRFDPPSLSSDARDSRFEPTNFTSDTRDSRFDQQSLTSDARVSRFDTPSLTSGIRDSQFDTPSLTSGTRDSRFDTPSLTSGTRDSQFDTPSLTSGTRDSRFDTPSLTSGTRDSQFDPPSLTSDARVSRFDTPSLTSDTRDSRFDQGSGDPETPGQMKTSTDHKSKEAKRPQSVDLYSRTEVGAPASGRSMPGSAHAPEMPELPGPSSGSKTVIYMGNIDIGVTAEEICNLLKGMTGVLDIAIAQHSKTWPSNSTSIFIEMASRAAADDCIQKYDGLVYLQRPLSVRIAEAQDYVGIRLDFSGSSGLHSKSPEVKQKSTSSNHGNISRSGTPSTERHRSSFSHHSNRSRSRTPSPKRHRSSFSRYGDRSRSRTPSPKRHRSSIRRRSRSLSRERHRSSFSHHSDRSRSPPSHGKHRSSSWKQQEGIDGEVSSTTRGMSSDLFSRLASYKKRLADYEKQQDDDELQLPARDDHLGQGEPIPVYTQRDEPRPTRPDEVIHIMEDEELSTTREITCRLKEMIKGSEAPMLGLSFVTEHQNDDEPDAPKYTCSLCDCNCGINFIIPHITGLQHRTKFMEKFHSEEYQQIANITDRTEKRARIEYHAKLIEVDMGREQINVACKDVWIVGDSLVRNAYAQAKRDGEENLGIKDRRVLWFVQDDMTWKQLRPKLQSEMLFRAQPAMIVVHVGANSMVETRMCTFIKHVTKDIAYMFKTYTSTLIVWSDILPRMAWRGAESGQLQPMEDKRKRVNRAGRCAIGRNPMGRMMTHPDITLANVALFDELYETVLTDEGNIILLATYKKVTQFFEHSDIVRL